MRKLIVVLFSLFCFSAFAAYKAADVSAGAIQSPTLMIQNTIGNLQQKLRTEHATLADSPAKLYHVIKTTLMAHVAVRQMAAMALGIKWRNATEAQRTKFIDQFGLLLTRTYASALLQVVSYDMKVFPIRGNWHKAQYVAVHGTVAPNSGAKPVDVTYYLERAKNQWFIYDFAVEGVSFVKNYQSQFQSISLNDLIAKIEVLNKEGGHIHVAKK
jgi:phospholipid transport system substrate-binding protein